MADPHSTRERSAWVLSRAGRDPGARRRGEKLAARARRITRDEAGAGDAGVAEVVTRGRFSRRWHKHEDRRVAWAVAYGLVEAGRALAVGPGLAIGWAAYGVLYKLVPTRGPLRWRRLAVVAGVVVPLVLLVVLSIGWFGGPVPFAAKYAALQAMVGAGRVAWLARAYGWEAVTGGSSGGAGTGPARPAPIVVRTPKPEAPPQPVPPTVVVMREKSDG
ncbi:hypothetical protein [Tsukamurella sp. USMM236]|uniref:hypothetical protein n=1 Tax=Tsukamurella sp. USMM236 TaxID=3081301 RepID=UPI0030196DBC